MKLVNIEETECPTCKSEIVQESMKNKHTNGHFNETRVFKCGHTISFSPNFMESKSTCNCPHTVEEMETKKLRTEAKAKLDIFVGTLDVDEKFKTAMRYSYRYI